MPTIVLDYVLRDGEDKQEIFNFQGFHTHQFVSWHVQKSLLEEGLVGERETIEGSMASTRIRREEEMWVCLWGDEKGLMYMES